MGLEGTSEGRPVFSMSEAKSNVCITLGRQLYGFRHRRLLEQSLPGQLQLLFTKLFPNI